MVPFASTRALLRIAGLLAVVPLGSLSAQDPPPPGTIVATIVDARSGGPLEGAEVRIAGVTGAVVASGASRSDGAISLDVPPATYTVEVELIGRVPVQVVDVDVGSGSRVELGRIPLEYLAIGVGEVVVSVVPGSSSERRIEAPSHVEVVGEASVEARITTSPTDHLRTTSGVDLIPHGVQSSNIVVRGFNNIFSGSLHALTDHRLIGLPSLRVNLLHLLPTNDLDIQRMEVMLGPGSALYGPNTADGVLHILTRSPLDYVGTTVQLAGGGQSLFKGAFRTAHRLSPTFGIKVSGQFLRADEWEYEDPVELENRRLADLDAAGFLSEIEARGFSRETAELAFGRLGIRDFGIDRWSAEARADWRFDRDGTLVVTGGRSMSSGIELTGLGAEQVEDFAYSFAQARVSRGRLFAQTYVNIGNAGDAYLLRDGLPLIDKSWQFVSQVQHGTQAFGGREQLTYGVDFSRTVPRSDGTIYGIFEDQDEVNEWGAYLQSETALAPRWDLILSGRIDLNSALPDPVFSPRAGLVYKPDPAQSFRLAYNRAFSTPNSLNLFLDVSGGRAPDLLGQLGYRIRARGTGMDGFTFSRPDGTLVGMRSPFNPGGAGQLIPADVETLWPLAVGAAAGIAAAGGDPMDSGLVALLQSLTPSAADIGIQLLDGNTGALTPLSPGSVANVPELRESTTTTWEVGYQGILAGRLRLAVDLWHTTRNDFVSPLLLATPLLLLDGEGIGAFVAGPWVSNRVEELVQEGEDPAAALAQAEQEAAVVIPELATTLGSLPVGVVASGDVDAGSAEMIATFLNVGEVKLWGADLGFEWFLDDQWTVQGSVSLVSDDWFEIEGAAPIALNAPRQKGSLGLTWQGERLEVGGRSRMASSFPAASAGLVGTECVTGGQGGVFEEPCVESVSLIDLTGRIQIPGTGASLEFTVNDLFDSGYRGFVGVPSIGRFAIIGMRWATGG